MVWSPRYGLSEAADIVQVCRCVLGWQAIK